MPQGTGVSTLHQPREDIAPDNFAVRVGAFFAAVFMVAGTYMPFLPVWLADRGLSASEIGIVFAAPMVLRILITPAIAFLADRIGNHRLVLIALSWCGAAVLLLLFRAETFLAILIVTLAFQLAWTAVMPLTETVAMGGVKARGLDYGRMRLWGSLSFIAVSFAGGFAVDRWGPEAALWLVLAGAVLSIAAAHLLPRPEGVAEPGRPRLRLSDAMALLKSPLFLLFLVAIGAEQASHALFYALGTHHWRALGYSTGTAGMLWAVGVIAEIALFAYSGWFARRIGVVQLMALGAAAAVVRWTVTAFDPPLAVLFPLQVLHGLTYGAAHTGAIYFIARAIPEGQAGTAQALYAATTAGIAMAGAMALSGPLYAAYAGKAYLAMAALGVVALAATVVLKARWDGASVIATRT